MFDTATPVRYPVKRRPAEDMVEVPVSALLLVLASQVRNAAENPDEVRKVAHSMDGIANAIKDAGKARLCTLQKLTEAEMSDGQGGGLERMVIQAVFETLGAACKTYNLTLFSDERSAIAVEVAARVVDLCSGAPNQETGGLCRKGQ